MIDQDKIDRVVERLTIRIEKANEYLMKQIGKSIKEIGTISPSKRWQLIQTLKYGGSFEKIVQRLSQITQMNVYDIYDIMEEIAKNDYRFASQFYKYRNKQYIPYKNNEVLQQQVRALASITANEYLNITRTSALGFGFIDENGKMTFKGLQQAYYELLDEAVLTVSQGKETFDSAMFRQLKQIGESGLKVMYPSGNSMRLDSAIRMNMNTGISNLHHEIQKQIGEEIDADGVELSVHLNPAIDHEEAQGKQFSNIEFENLQTTGIAKSYDGKLIDMTIGSNFRPIMEYNCKHYTFSIILGVNKPQYSNNELKEIIESNNKGFDFEGKHYTNYEGEQLQRKIELAVRKQKDTQILAKASDNAELIKESQTKITQLNRKYKELSKISGLPMKRDRMRVSGYKRTAVAKIK